MTYRSRLLLSCAIVTALSTGTALAVHAKESRLGTDPVGVQADGTYLTSTGQRLTPAGSQLRFPGRPTAVALRPDGRTATLLNSKGSGLVVVDLATQQVLQSLPAGGGSFDGIAYSHKGDRLAASQAGGSVLDLTVAADGKLTQAGTTAAPRVLPNPAATDTNASANNAYPGGLAFSEDDRTVYVAYSVLNSLGVLDVASHALTAQIPVGNAPHSVVVRGGTAWVSDEGGRRAVAGDTTNNSDGTAIVSDPTHGSAATGVVSVVDLTAGREVRQVPVGLHPTALALDGDDLYVADTNSDTVSVVDVTGARPTTTLPVEPYAGAPYGSHPNGLAVLSDGRLAVSLGRDNAVAVLSRPRTDRSRTLQGLLPTAWYPTAVAQAPTSGDLLVVNGKGFGNSGPASSAGSGRGRATGSSYVGSLSFVPLPDRKALEAGTAAVRRNNGWDTTAVLPARPGIAPRALPERTGEPSTIKHVIYIAKENRTYDQVLGDDPRGNGDPGLTQFGAAVTPNQHRLATQFPLLDNFYDSGQLSADGHQWVVQGDSPDYLEKAFGGFTRSYPSQSGDALAYLPGDFLWENALAHHRSVRDYGEYASSLGKGVTSTDIPSLQPLVVPEYPGFDPSIPDVARVQVFLKDLARWEQSGGMPSLMMMTLPQDHTVAYAPSYPSVDAMVADNDLALGQLVEAVSRSSFWKDTLFLVEEDDSQNGLDHVDAHRSPFFAVSPWTKHGGFVDSHTYTQVDALRTIELVLGLPPTGRLDAASAGMPTLFADTPDLTPYTAAVPTLVGPKVNPPTSALTGVAKQWSLASAAMDFSRPDAVDENLLAHAVWYAGHAFRTPYPGESRVLLPREVPFAADLD